MKLSRRDFLKDLGLLIGVTPLIKVLPRLEPEPEPVVEEKVANEAIGSMMRPSGGYASSFCWEDLRELGDKDY